MINLSDYELSEISHHLGESYPINIEPVYGGNINSTWRLDFKQFKIFVKKNISKKPFLKFEEYCLSDLKNYIDEEYLLIPKVIIYQKIKSAEILVLEWIDMNNYDQRKLGKGLAIMHLNSQLHASKKFGYSVAGFIGTNPQTRGWDENWADFFIQFRIMPQLSYLKQDFLSSEIKVNLISKIKKTLSVHEPMISLVHGDLWSGNIGIGKNDKGIIFDPASWWADNEVDISMSKLFGGFGYEFYEEYYKVIKKLEDNDKRSAIYNLYHILNHANMFGGGYFSQLRKQIQFILDC